MEIGRDIKGNKFELPVDYNGHAAQILWLGGRTIKVSNGNFIAESTVLRLCNTGSSPVQVQLQNVDWKGKTDEGISILPNTKEVFAVILGDEFKVTGDLEVTFLRDKSLVPEKNLGVFTPTAFESTNIGGVDAVYIKEGNFLKVSGMLDFYYQQTSPYLGPQDGNRVGIIFTFENDFEEYPLFQVDVVQENQVVGTYYRSSMDSKVLFLTPLVTYPGQQITFYIRWSKEKSEVFIIDIDKDIVLKQ